MAFFMAPISTLGWWWSFILGLRISVATGIGHLTSPAYSDRSAEEATIEQLQSV